MQGRLVPAADTRIQYFPRDKWAEEFKLAASAGLDCIEWIYDLYGADINPLAKDRGIDEIKSLSQEHGIQVLSVCADYFMDRPLVRADASDIEDRLKTLVWLMHRCHACGISRIILPFVDISRMETDAEAAGVVTVIEKALDAAGKLGVEIHLETSLAPERFVDLIDRLPHELVKINYDSGNSAALGFHPRDEFAAYGKRVGSVHIKDRIRGGGTVPLGRGDADFPALFECLKRVGYQGDFILQVARDVPGAEVAWARKNTVFVMDYLRAYKPGACYGI